MAANCTYHNGHTKKDSSKGKVFTISLTLLYTYLVLTSAWPLLYKNRPSFFGPGEVVEARRRQHCQLGSKVDIDVEKLKTGQSELNSTRPAETSSQESDTIGMLKAVQRTTRTNDVRIRGAFVLLIRGHAEISGYNETRLWLLHLKDTLPWLTKYDIIFYHEGDVTVEHQHFLRSGNILHHEDDTGYGKQNHRQTHTKIDSAEFNITFVDLSVQSDSAFRMPRSIPKYTPEEAFPARLGYLHMCRFYTLLLFPMLWDQYDYAFRLDDDVFLLDSITTDLFELMAEKNLVYLYGSEVPEWNKATRRTFGPWLHRHILRTPRGKGSQYNFTNKFTSNEIWSELGSKMYFTNFFLTRLDWWKRKNVQDFLHEIDRSGGIYYFRWGDAPIHTVILQLFADICVVMPLCDISYYHSSTGHLIKKCTATNEDPEPYLPSSFFERK